MVVSDEVRQLMDGPWPSEAMKRDLHTNLPKTLNPN